MRSTLYRSLGAIAIAAAIAGCNEDPGAENGEGDHKPDPLPTPTDTAPAYPPPPYDVSQGAVITDFEFEGFVNSVADNATLQAIHLSDFYNPHAGDASYQPDDPALDDRLYPPGSPYGAGKPKPTALFISIASVWCGPCNEEAKSLLPTLYAKYKPCGGQFLFQLAEGPMPGTTATEQNLRAWTKKYAVDYPATFDPSRSIYSGNSFPVAVIVDTRTMKIVSFNVSVPDDSFWKTYESLLDPTCLASN
jgi:hypothetical protein